MGKEEILNYVMNSPENTNPNVLGSMLDGVDSSTGGGGMVVHFNIDTTDPSNIKAISTTLASEVANAYCNGANIVFHCPTTGYTFESYFSIAYYTPKYTGVEFDSVETWYFVGNGSNITDHGVTNNDGYIECEVYVD